MQDHDNHWCVSMCAVTVQALHIRQAALKSAGGCNTLIFAMYTSRVPALLGLVGFMGCT